MSLSAQELEELWVYKALLVELTKKLTYCVKAELIPLMEVTGVLEVSVTRALTELMASNRKPSFTAF